MHCISFWRQQPICREDNVPKLSLFESHLSKAVFVFVRFPLVLFEILASNAVFAALPDSTMPQIKWEKGEQFGYNETIHSEEEWWGSKARTNTSRQCNLNVNCVVSTINHCFISVLNTFRGNINVIVTAGNLVVACKLNWLHFGSKSSLMFSVMWVNSPVLTIWCSKRGCYIFYAI